MPYELLEEILRILTLDKELNWLVYGYGLFLGLHNQRNSILCLIAPSMAPGP